MFYSILMLILSCHIIQNFSNKPHFMSEDEASKLYDEWTSHDSEYDPKDENEEIVPDPAKHGYNPKAGPEAVAVTMLNDSDIYTTEEASSVWEIELKNMYIPVNRYVLNKDTVIFLLTDKNMKLKLIQYFTSVKNCQQIEIDSQKISCNQNSEDDDL